MREEPGVGASSGRLDLGRERKRGSKEGLRVFDRSREQWVLWAEAGEDREEQAPERAGKCWRAAPDLLPLG